MYTTIPVPWREQFGPNVTLRELQDTLVTLHIPTIIVMALVMVVGVFGNAVALLIYYRHRPTFFRVFIIWLGCIDIIACAVGGPLLIYSLLNPYDFQSVGVCKTFRFIHVFLVVTSALILVFISIERYRQLCGNSLVETQNKRVHKMCTASCVIGSAVATPAVFVYGPSTVETGVEYNNNGTECFIEPTVSDTMYPAVYFLVQMVLFLVSLILMIVLYTKIGRRLVVHRRFSRRHMYRPRPSVISIGNGSIGSVQARRDSAISIASRGHSQRRQSVSTDKLSIEITKMLFIVTAVFVISFLPHLVLLILTAVNRDFTKDMSAVGIVFYNLGLRTFVINNMANPVIYFLCQRTFRAKCKMYFWKTVTCCKRHNNDVMHEQKTDSSVITDTTVASGSNFERRDSCKSLEDTLVPAGGMNKAFCETIKETAPDKASRFDAIQDLARDSCVIITDIADTTKNTEIIFSTRL